MSQHPHTSRYARLVSGFSAAAFALLMTVTLQQVEVQDSPLMARAALDCTKMPVAIAKCEKKQALCVRKASTKTTKCNQKADKTFRSCQSKAVKAKATCLKKAKTESDVKICLDRQVIAQNTCISTFDAAKLNCTADGSSNEVDCGTAAELCKVKIEETYIDC